MKRASLLALTAVLLLGGCAESLVAGAERVRVVASESAVKDCALVQSRTGTVGSSRTDDLPIMAQNFGHSIGADTVLLRVDGGYPRTVYTFEGWRCAK